MIALLVAIARHGGRGLARLCLWPITAYFVLVRGPERRASRAWLSRVRGRRAGLWAAARHVHAFSATILDRLFLLGGRMDLFDIRVHGLEPLEALVDHGRGPCCSARTWAASTLCGCWRGGGPGCSCGWCWTAARTRC
ncbi:hypothetical protein [Pseudoxanthomonas sp.]|uniref:hypothetical protein n=1 Tax=Pseudoxanthomonas sp. TaxID=1871049 RepID=UPI00258A8351|nr:hypothetical protein [Pseudoxanthomonas sp.]MCR6687737.1 hypothetical protein [Pseudoxanthomonas sp.]